MVKRKPDALRSLISDVARPPPWPLAHDHGVRAIAGRQPHRFHSHPELGRLASMIMREGISRKASSSGASLEIQHVLAFCWVP
jgi:hypothetical protein